MTVQKKESESVRQFILVKLNHVEKGEGIHPHIVIGRIRECFTCRSIVVAKEKHQEEGCHYHIGVLNRDASRYTANIILRKRFP